jgi:hypothetical protein
MFNPNRVARSLELGLIRARASVDTPRPLCPWHPETRALKLHITHPARVIPYKQAFFMGCEQEIAALHRADYRVEVLNA